MAATKAIQFNTLFCLYRQFPNLDYAISSISIPLLYFKKLVAKAIGL